MSLAEHDPRYRRIWMFSRPKRYIESWKIAQIIALLQGQIQSSEWSGNQTLQDQFTKALESAGLKRAGIQYDPRSGGARTYVAQLESLGLIFKRSNSQIFLTIAGEDMAKGSPPLPILQAMLLRHQYPSVYSNNPNVKIHPAIRVKPFVFVLKLLKHTEYLTVDELVVPVVYGHNYDCIPICLEKICLMREGASLSHIIDAHEDLYTPRTLGRSFENALVDARDIANTCMNYLKAGCLINVERVHRKQKITTAHEFSQLIDMAVRQAEKFIPEWDENESFQRRLGCWNRTKDTRTLTKEGTEAPSPFHGIISSLFFSYLAESPVRSYPDEFVERMMSDYGFSRGQIDDTIRPILPQSLSYFESTYIDLSKSGGVKATEFEKATGKLFEEEMDFTVRHTGQLKRTAGVGGYADLFLIALDDFNCAIVDTKSTPAYSLTSSDFSKMADNYIPNYNELSVGKARKLEFCTFVAGGFHGDVAGRLKQLTGKTGTPVSAISAFDLLRLCDAGLRQTDVRKLFRQSKILCCDDYDSRRQRS